MSTRLSILGWAGILAVAVTGCQDTQGPGTRAQDTTPVLATLIVSNPTLSALFDPATSPHATVASGDVFVSLPPGTFPDGDSIVLQTRRSGAQASAILVDGGMDPLPIAAEAGDTLDILIYLDDHDVRRFISRVPLHKPPVVVRTDPPPTKRDVPLNAIMIMVFSEPIKPATLTSTSVQLLHNGVPVPGTVGFGDSTHLTVRFTPDQPLAAGASYTLTLSQAIQDLGGDPLAAPVTVGFVTQDAPSSLSGVYERITPHSLVGYHSRFVIRQDGTFEHQYETTTFGSFAYTGRYWRTSSAIILDFDSSNTAGPWTATARLSGDSLAVGYNVVMQLADFEDGLYVLSTDTASLAFVRDGQIYRINPDGTGLVAVSDGPGDAAPAWSPDGQRIAFSRVTGQDQFGLELRDIYIMNADGSNVVRRTSGGYNSEPAWSPDGTRIAFAAMGGGSLNVYVMSADDDGTGATNLVNRPGLDGQPAWSPDGSRIAYASDWVAYDFTMDIFITSLDGAQVTQSTNGFGSGSSLIQYYQPSWSPDGQRIAVVSCVIAFVTCDAGTVLLMNHDGSGRVPLAATSGFARPTWSRDGQRIAFGSLGLIAWTRVDGSTPAVIVTTGHSPAWRP